MNARSLTPPALLLCLMSCSLPVPPPPPKGAADGPIRQRRPPIEDCRRLCLPGAPSLGGTEKVLVVAVSNQGFVPDAMDEYWDRHRALERYFKDDETGLVYFEFGPDGSTTASPITSGPATGAAIAPTLR